MLDRRQQQPGEPFDRFLTAVKEIAHRSQFEDKTDTRQSSFWCTRPSTEEAIVTEEGTHSSYMCRHVSSV